MLQEILTNYIMIELETKSKYNVIQFNDNPDLSILYDTKFLDKSILHKINKNITGYKYSSNDGYEFIIYNNDKHPPKKSLVNWIFYIKRLFKNNKLNKIHLLLTNCKKTFPLKWKPLGPLEVNSGMNVYYLNNYQNNGTIYIWRKEELKKVLTHELIHSFYIDDIKQVKGGLLLNESITEFLALYLITINSNNYNKYAILEEQYQQQKMMDILHYYKGHEYKQDTGVYEYYFIKAFMWHNREEGIKLLNKLLTNNEKLTYNNVLNFYRNSYNKFINKFDSYKFNQIANKTSLKMCYNKCV